LEAFHIWSHVDDIGEFDDTMAFHRILLDDEDVHVDSMLLLSNVHVTGSYMVYGGFL